MIIYSGRSERYAYASYDTGIAPETLITLTVSVSKAELCLSGSSSDENKHSEYRSDNKRGVPPDLQ